MKPFFFFRKQQLSPADQAIRQEYLARFKEKSAKKTPLRKLSFVVLDTETSGLDYKNDHILSIAAIPIANFQMDLGARFEAYFYRDDFVPGDSVQVHGILNRHLKDGEDEKAILASFLDFLKTSIIVGHHVGFDLAILNQALKRNFHLKLRNKTLDTALLAYRIENPFGGRSRKPTNLDALCKEYQIPLGERHTAAGDTYITALLFLKLLAKLERRKVHTLRDLI